MSNYKTISEEEEKSWTQRQTELAQQYANREPFRYDPNEDTLYQQMVDRYVRQGSLAMEDTMGQAAALTGGYGNSYAQSVGQQNFQGYLQGVSDLLPDYYQMALDRYTQEGEDLLNRYSMASQWAAVEQRQNGAGTSGGTGIPAFDYGPSVRWLRNNPAWVVKNPYIEHKVSKTSGISDFLDTYDVLERTEDETERKKILDSYGGTKKQKDYLESKFF